MTLGNPERAGDLSQQGAALSHGSNLSHLRRVEFPAVRGVSVQAVAEYIDRVVDVGKPRDVLQVFGAIVLFVSVFMVDVVTSGTWTNERRSDNRVNRSVMESSVYRENDTAITLPMLTLSHRLSLSPENISEIRDAVRIESNNGSPSLFAHSRPPVASGGMYIAPVRTGERFFGRSTLGA